jgi:hypothetical protein
MPDFSQTQPPTITYCEFVGIPTASYYETVGHYDQFKFKSGCYSPPTPTENAFGCGRFYAPWGANSAVRRN